MYLVEDEPFQQARSIISALAKELGEQEASRFGRPVDLRKVIRHSAGADLPVGGEGEFLSAIAERLEKSYPFEALLPREGNPGPQ
jgi:hypothetical protein